MVKVVCGDFPTEKEFIFKEIQKRQLRLDENVRLFELEGISKLKDSTIERLTHEIYILKNILKSIS